MLLRTLSLLAAAPLLAQSPQWLGPTSGTLYDPPTRSLRAIVGLPGSAYLGKALAEEIDQAWVAPDAERAIVRRENRLLLATGLSSGAPTLSELDIPSSETTLVAWSGDSASAILTRPDLPGLHWYRARAASLEAGGTWPVPGDARVLSLISGRAGQSALALLGSEDAASVYVFTSEGSPALLASASGQALLAPVQNQDSALLLDRAARSLSLISDWSSTASVAPLLQELDAPADLSAALLHAPSGRLFLAGASPRRLKVYNSATRELLSDAELETEPGNLTPLSRPGLYLLSPRAKAEQPAFLLDAATGEVYFVPAGGAQ